MKTSIRTHEGRVALVTGAAQGIGQALAFALAERGAEIIVTDLTLPQETVNKIGPTGHAFQLDVTQEEDWHSLSIRSRDVGEVDIVVNNAGYFPNRSIDDLDLPTWRKTIATNLDSHFLSAKYFLPGMRQTVGIVPPSITYSLPVIADALSDARKATSSATSAGVFGRPNGIPPSISISFCRVVA